MIRIAFTIIGGENWIGGYNYLLNLVSILSEFQSDKITPVIFTGSDTSETSIQPFKNLPNVEIITSDVFNLSRKKSSLVQSLIKGYDDKIRSEFQNNNIDVVFEAAQFYGKKIKIPTIAWIADFQHQLLPDLFSKFAYWKRELGFQAQIKANRTIMLSSFDALKTFEKFYSTQYKNISVVNFAIPSRKPLDLAFARKVADQYDLPQNYIFLPNQFWKHKNHLVVIEALKLLKSEGRECVIVSTGKQFDPRHPNHFSQVQTFITEYGLEHNFRLLGLIPHEHIAPLTYSSNALLNPSLFEGWSTTVEEARTLGVQMILSDIAVHSEQMGENAIYFDPDDSIELAKILETIHPQTEDEKSKSQIEAGKNAFLRVEKFARDFSNCISLCLKNAHQ